MMTSPNSHTVLSDLSMAFLNSKVLLPDLTMASLRAGKALAGRSASFRKPGCAISMLSTPL